VSLRCTKCQSLDISCEEFRKGVALVAVRRIQQRLCFERRIFWSKVC
jgi:hypothetical protein